MMHSQVCVADRDQKCVVAVLGYGAEIVLYSVIICNVAMSEFIWGVLY